MDHLASLVLWCVVQVSLVSLVGVVLSLAMIRRHPLAACSPLCTATIVAAILTLLAPLPVHLWFAWEPATIASVPTVSRTVDKPTDATSAPSLAPSVPLIDGEQLIASLRSLAVHVDHFDQQRPGVVQTVAWLWAALMAIGVLQLAVGIAFVRRLRRHSTPIIDSDLFNLLSEVSAQLACRAIPDLRESRDFSDAAVAGWRKPAIILPSDWRDWCDDERRTVLAHEVAHIVRHDVGWRAVASSLLAFHFYNPAVHWLLRRLLLCQELATDEFAAAAIGPQCYLRSLSSLALRQDDRTGSSVAPAVLPVFSGHLIRRIRMLQTMTVSRNRRRSIVSVLISAALLALGLATVATRGLAEPPSGEKPATPAVKSVKFTNLNISNAKVIDPAHKMFRRMPIDPSFVGAENPHGMFAVRLRELLSRPEFEAMLPVMNNALAQGLEQGLKTTSTPVIRLEDVEWVAARPVVACKKSPVKEGEAEDPNRKTHLIFGAGAYVVKLAQPLDLKAWVEQFAPQTVVHRLEGKNVYQWKLAVIAPMPMYVWMEDETTLRMNDFVPDKITLETKLADLLNKASSEAGDVQPLSENTSVIPWTTIWQRIDTGLASVILAQADFGGLFFDLENRQGFQTETLDAVERALLAMKSRCQSTACSFDLVGTPTQIVLRFTLPNASGNDAAKSADDLRELVTQCRIFFQTVQSEEAQAKEGEFDADPHRPEVLAMMIDLCGAATIVTETYDDQTAAVVLTTTLPFARLWGMILAGSAGEK